MKSLLAQVAGTPWWAIAIGALFGSGGIIAVIIQSRKEVRIEAMRQAVTSETRDATTSQILFDQIAKLREELGAMKERLKRSDDRTQTLRYLALIEINDLRGQLKLPLLKSWPENEKLLEAPIPA